MIAGNREGAEVESGTRKRAVGTRDRVMSHLMAVGEVTDPAGMASTVLAETVGYPGSSVAFAQLLSGMERSGLIEREIRGKRTYRISPAPAAAAELSRAGSVARRGQAATPPPAPAPGGAAEFDYDELARRLLVQVVQRLSEAPPEPAHPEPAAGEAGLQQTVASLERKLASVQSRQRRLSAENTKLREQLRAAQQSLARAQAQAQPGQLDTSEVRLLERLLSPLRQQRGGREEAGAS